jgi:Predicted membrane protein (DUF2306)
MNQPARAPNFNMYGWIIFAFLAVVIGLYPFSYFIVNMQGGLLSSKPAALLKTAWIGFFYCHIIFGGIALLTGWTQFSSRIRNKHVKVHHTLGKIYVTCAITSGLAALYLAAYATAGVITHFGFGILATLWIYCTFRAYLFIVMKKNTYMHQRWMIRSYALCFAAVTLRIWLPLFTGVFHFDFIISYQIISWLCWVPNIIVAELIIRRLNRFEKGSLKISRA